MVALSYYRGYPKAMSRAIVSTIVLVLLIVGIAFLTSFPKLTYTSARPLEIPSIGGEFFYVDAGDIAHYGSSRVLVLRLNEPIELIPYHFKDAGMEEPIDAKKWSKSLQAPVVFNAGQFDENMEHLGWLKSEGRWLFRKRKKKWLGLLATGPQENQVWGRIIDMQNNPTDYSSKYRNLVQSMMLLDEHKEVRVRESDIKACRAVVAEDTAGRLLLLFTEGAVTLGDLARYLAKSELNLLRAMNLDGGGEAQVVINTPELKYNHFGQFGRGSPLTGAAGLFRTALPTVIALRTKQTGD